MFAQSTAEAFRKFAVRPSTEPMAVEDAVALVENPEKWLAEVSTVEVMFAALLALLDRQAALEFAIAELGPDGYGTIEASNALRREVANLGQMPDPAQDQVGYRTRDPATGEPWPGLQHRADFEHVLAARMNGEAYTPFAGIEPGMVPSDLADGASVSEIVGRIELLDQLEDRQRVFVEYLMGSMAGFSWEQRPESMAAQMLLQQVADAKGRAVRARSEAARQEGTIAAERAEREARQRREEREAAEEEERRARQRRADAEAAEREAEEEAARRRFVASMGS